jgi:predicted AAA+ superfamily ATPase
MNANNQSEIEGVLKRIVKNQNPWHDPVNREWYLKDGALRELMDAVDEGLYKPPKIFYFLKKMFFEPLYSNNRAYGVLIIRGPRRIGKTSTLKYMIKDYIQRGYNSKSFIYLSLDSDELLRDFDKKRYLRELVDEIIRKFKKANEPLIIILDEVTFYKGWARAIKNLIDSGSIGPGIALIATGSYSLDLSSAKRELAGRFGPLGERLRGEQFFYPRRFIEMAEAILGSKFQSSIRGMFGKGSGRRMGIMEYLAGFQTDRDSLYYGYKNILNERMQAYYDDLHNLFENIYLYSGGYPRSIYEAIKSQRTGEINIPFARYSDDIFDLLVTDSTKFRLSNVMVKQILSMVKSPSMRLSSGYGTLTRNLRKDETEKYISYLEASGLFSFLPNISSPAQIDVDSACVTTRNDRLKLIVNDPAAFISIYLCSRGAATFNQVKRLLLEERVREHLFEAVIVSHLRYLPRIRIAPENMGYIITEDEEELADGFAWYLDRSNRLVLLAVEAKYTQKDVDIGEIRRKARILKENFQIKRLIVTTNHKTLVIEDDYAIIPAEIFLLLL